MTDQELSELPKYQWMESRIPARDALSTFAPDAPEPDPVIAEMQSRAGGSRWYPIQGGHRVLIPFEGGAYDSSRFTIETRAWDHEHCDVCGEQIPAMTLVTLPSRSSHTFCFAPVAMSGMLHPNSRDLGGDFGEINKSFTLGRLRPGGFQGKTGQPLSPSSTFFRSACEQMSAHLRAVDFVFLAYAL